MTIAICRLGSPTGYVERYAVASLNFSPPVEVNSGTTTHCPPMPLEENWAEALVMSEPVGNVTVDPSVKSTVTPPTS